MTAIPSIAASSDDRLVHVAPAPVLVRLERPHDRVRAVPEVRGRVPVGRGVAAGHVAAREALPQVDPVPRADRQALGAALGRARRHVPDLVQMRTGFHACSSRGVAGSNPLPHATLRRPRFCPVRPGHGKVAPPRPGGRTPDGRGSVDFDEVADELYGIPPEEFIATRRTREEEARAEGDRVLATSISTLPKPSLAAWAVNVLVRAQRDQIAGLVELGGLLREAQEKLAGD